MISHFSVETKWPTLSLRGTWHIRFICMSVVCRILNVPFCLSTKLRTRDHYTAQLWCNEETSPLSACSQNKLWDLTYFSQEQQQTNVRCYAKACWFRFHGNQQYVTTQQYCNALLAGFTVGRSIRNSPLLCNWWRNCVVTSAVFSRPRCSILWAIISYREWRVWRRFGATNKHAKLSLTAYNTLRFMIRLYCLQPLLKICFLLPDCTSV
jgi:hypothetical protein